MNQGRSLPAIPTWRDKHSPEALEEAMLDPIMFNRAYGMRPVSPEELKFPSFKTCCVPGLTASDLRKQGMPAYIGVDLAGKNRPGNAIVAIGIKYPEMRRVMLEVRRGNWSSPKTAGVLAEVCSHHNVQYIQVENNAYQQSLIDWIKHEKPDFPYWMKVEPFTTTSAKNEEWYGLPGLEVEFKNNGWIFPLSEWEGHGSTCQCDWCAMKTEFEDYPKGATTDIVMATYFARDAANKWAPSGVQRPRRSGNVNAR